MPAAVKRPFWLHQLAEYIIGLAALATGFQSQQPLIPAVMGGLVLLNAAIADGPFGAFRWVGRRRHRWADWAVLMIMAVLTAIPGADLSARVVQGALVVVFLVVILGTNYTEPIQKRAQIAGEGGRALNLGRRAGRMSGTMAAHLRQRAQRRDDWER